MKEMNSVYICNKYKMNEKVQNKVCLKKINLQQNKRENKTAKQEKANLFLLW